MRKLLTCALVAAITAVMMATLAVPAVTAVGSENILLYGPQKSAGGQSAAVTDFTVTVENPGAVSLEDNYINMTVSVAPDTLGVGTNKTLAVRFDLNDGVTNVSLGNQSLAAKNDKTVWLNLTYADPLMSSFVVNGTALLTVTLGFSNSTGGVHWCWVDTHVSTFGIYKTDMSSAILSMVPLIVTVAIVAMILPMLGRIMHKTKR